MIEKIVQALAHYKMLDSTYILFTSDHGYHMGQFGMPLDKRLPYEFDIRIPFWLSGPNISSGQHVSTPVLTIDIAPTLLDIAGVTNRYDDMDGLSILPLLTNTTDDAVAGREDAAAVDTVPIITNYTGIQGRQSFLVEYSGEGSAHTNSETCAGQLNHDLENMAECSQDFGCKCQDSRNNTYTCLRTLGQEDTIFCQFEVITKLDNSQNIQFLKYHLA